MSDFNDNTKRYTPNTPPIPPRAPDADSVRPIGAHDNPQTGQAAPAAPYQPVYNQRPVYDPRYNSAQNARQNYTVPPQYNQAVPPQPPVQPNGYYNPNYAYTPKPVVKNPMSSGAKAFVAIVIAILSASLIGFIVYVGNNAGNSNFSVNNQATEDFNYTMPTGSPFSEEEPTASDKEYKQSDLSKETDSKFSGIKLNKKPSGKKNYGTNYAFKNVEKSVVGVICYVDGQDGTSTSYTSMGSGIVVTSDGYILTNAHIINNSRTAYMLKIVTADKKEYNAGVVGFDSRYDLAVLKADAKNLTPAEFGNSDSIEVAEDVIAVGNPRSINFQNSVTKGIVSAVNRQVSATNNARFIQTDAAINPGNSGGPLCNMYGQVIGISTSKIALEEYEGMCFAIPINTAKKVADSIIRRGYVENRVKIGIVGTIATKQSDGASGILIEEISAGGPLDGTGAQKGDVVTKVDGKSVATFADVYDILEAHKKGDKIKVALYRPSADKTYDITVTLQEDKT